MGSKIEWLRGPDGKKGETWNPLLGCDRVSAGCDGCYAVPQSNLRASNPNPKTQDAFAGLVHRNANGELDWTGRVNLLHDRLQAPFGWKRPRYVFVNSLADLFHDDVDDDYIAKVFAVMALNVRHVFIVLTKRPGRMRSLLNRHSFWTNVGLQAVELWDRYPPHEHISLDAHALPNVILGVSVEDQHWADVRIPLLLDTPAAWRAVSAEPLLGPVDLSRYLPPITPMAPEDAPETWGDWEWPSWVPAPVRIEIEDFWSNDWGRGPRAWLRSSIEAGAPAFGSTVTMQDGYAPDGPMATGRFVHAWNNIGRIVNDEGGYHYTSFHKVKRPIDLVIAGGESGHRARAMHPDWARTLRDQTTAAGASFFFKQWGEWGPAPFIVRVCDPEVGWKGTDGELEAAKRDAEARGATHVHTGNPYTVDGETRYHLHEIGHKPWSAERVGLAPPHEPMRRWGKKAAGNELDGRTWTDMPIAPELAW